MNFKSQQGISLFISIVIMAILLSIGLGIGLILLGQLRVVSGMSDSVVAFFAADSGVERLLYEVELVVSGELDPPDNEIRYEARFIEPGPGCPAFSYCIRSVGFYKGTKRAIEIVR